MIALLATFFGSGRFPVAPGTAGSLAACVCGWVLVAYASVWWFLFATFAACIVGVLICSAYLKQHPENTDPKEVVIDEVAGQWLSFVVCGILVGYATQSPEALSFLMIRAVDEPLIWVAGFICFRAFDIVKPWPISWLDRHIKGGLGIMLDDIAAGIIAGFMLFAALSIAPILTMNITVLP